TNLRGAFAPLLSGQATQEALDNARNAWKSARIPYQQTEFGRFYNGPIDDPALGNLEGMINPWPLDEATIDYVRGPDGMPLYGGIIDLPAMYPSVTEQVIEQANMVPGEENVTTGFHAIEFLLWGQDFNPDGPGNRPYQDYLDGQQQNADRRREYLDVASQLLIDQLTTVRDAWAPAAANYRASFVAMDPKQALSLILLGMGKFTNSELANQRINVPYTSKDQEDEHSCFSDYTNTDLMNDVLGLSNLYYGRYQRPDGSTIAGPSLSDLVKARDAALDARVRGQVDQALAQIRAWPTVANCPSAALQGNCPFDQLVRGTDDAPGRQAIAAVINDLRALSTSILDIATLFGITIDLSQPGEP
ncbi:MAG TPA: imelysin family protein, partial [Polyangiaceae bacterium]|nr:imelysin family protein [Polyangiaceae bacterium]